MSTRRAMAYVRAMPALKAEENLQLSRAVAVGSGTLKKHASDGIQQDWRKQISGPRSRPRKTSTDEFLVALAGTRIGVVKADPQNTSPPERVNDA